jgi:putative FmdB family regulatory protein
MSYYLAVDLAVLSGECQDSVEGGPVPTYQYTCTDCGEPLEAVQKFSDDALTVCPACGGKLRKVFSAVGIVFKGSGFYRNDSRKGAEVGAGAAKANGSDAGSADSGGGSSSESSSGKPSESKPGDSGSGQAGKSGESSGKSGESSGKSGESSSGKSGESSGKSSAGEKKSESSRASSASSSGTKVA